MELNAKHIFLFLSVILTALSAGLFYAWVVSVIPGTKKITDLAYLETMQTINREILNAGFFIIFFGSLIVLLGSTFLQYRAAVNSVFYYTLFATILYGIGTIGVTMFGNVPLNNLLESLDLSTLTAEDFRNTRVAFEEKWNHLNLIRTVAALISFVLVLVAFAKN